MKARVTGSGPPVVFIHGIPTSGRLWDFVTEPLQVSLTCVTVDLPGFGETPPFVDGSRDPARYAAELDRLRALLEIDSWHVVGHDAGAAIAVHYATAFRERVRRVVLCSPPVFPEFRIPWFFRIMRARVVGDAAAPLVSFVLWRTGIHRAIERRDASIRPIVDAFHRPFAGLSGVRHFVNMLRWGEPTEVLARTAASLPLISAKTLVLHGQRDGAVPRSFAERAAAIIPDARLQMLPCGHFIPLDVPDAFCAIVEPFLTGLRLVPRAGCAVDHDERQSAVASRRSGVSKPSVNVW
jgi:pimeloyl-ACP methyl ester carboxylesterase